VLQTKSFDLLKCMTLNHDAHVLLLMCRHGDLKAGNVLLTAASITNAGQHCCCDEHDEQSAAEVWAQAGSLPLIAKVADFGLAMPLGPTDTHATMLARVSQHLWLASVSCSCCCRTELVLLAATPCVCAQHCIASRGAAEP
jgi:serine/threonine protein kinase